MSITIPQFLMIVNRKFKKLKTAVWLLTGKVKKYMAENNFWINQKLFQKNKPLNYFYINFLGGHKIIG